MIEDQVQWDGDAIGVALSKEGLRLLLDLCGVHLFLFLGLAVAVLAFFVVSKNTIGAYGEVQDGKGTWGQLGVNFGAGVLLLVFVVFLLTEAADIL